MKTKPTEIVNVLQEARRVRSRVDDFIDNEGREMNVFAEIKSLLDSAVEHLRFALEASVIEQAAKEYEERE